MRSNTLTRVSNNPGAVHYGLLREVKDNIYVDLEGVPVTAETEDINFPENDAEPYSDGDTGPGLAEEENGSSPQKPSPRLENHRVFITHGKNKEIVEQLKELLAFGKFEPVVSEEQDTVSKPVPDKVMDDMRSCYAAIIHVGTEMELLDPEGNKHKFLNQNVLIEIGAALALYKRRFILLVERGATLPSNLQGLYEVRYEGGKLDYEATMKLLGAFNDFRT